ncbi:unnamed protein product, partial [Prunus brigantina]
AHPNISFFLICYFLEFDLHTQRNMTSVCAEQQHKLHPSHQLLSSKKSLHNTTIDIPPRKLLTRRTQTQDFTSSSPEMYSPSFSTADEALLLKFLPYNAAADDSDEDDANSSDPYSSDHFRMFEFKVRRCTRSRSHDWTDCPFAHPGEKARRRDPRRYHYSGTVCADYRRGSCSRGDSCEFAHGVFECWLHPARYRTEACKDGKQCKRKVCFFAHTPRQLRVLPIQSSADHTAAALSPTPKKKYGHLSNSVGSPGSNKHCCLFCHSAVTTSSPTSTLLGMSHLSPPLSPAGNHRSSVNGFNNSPVMSRCSGLGLGLDQMHASTAGMMSYKDVLAELMSSLEAVKFSESAAASPINPNAPRWVDVSFNSTDDLDQQQQFILSPSTPSPSRPFGGRGINFSDGDENGSSRKSSLLGFDDNYYKPNNINDEIINGGGGSGSGSSDPDLGWVNELLM